MHYRSRQFLLCLTKALYSLLLTFLLVNVCLKCLTLTNMSSSDLRRFSSFSISIWHVWQTYRWLTAGPPPYLQGEVHINSHRNELYKGSYTATVNTWEDLEMFSQLAGLLYVPAVKVIPHVLWQHYYQVIDECRFVWWHT